MLIMAIALSHSGFGQSSNSGSAAPCAADARWLNVNADLSYSRTAQSPVSLSLLAHLSEGSRCSSAEITFTATFLTESLEFICSGSMRQAMKMSANVQSFNLEIRPFTQLDFLRWRNQPGIRGIQQGKRMACSNIDGTSDVGDSDRQRAGWIRLSVGVLPAAGGLAVTEAMLRIAP
jgi:hypothetical protein